MPKTSKSKKVPSRKKAAAPAPMPHELQKVRLGERGRHHQPGCALYPIAGWDVSRLRAARMGYKSCPDCETSKANVDLDGPIPY